MTATATTYTVKVIRERRILESTVLTVQARSEDDACEKAGARAVDLPDGEWDLLCDDPCDREVVDAEVLP